MLSEDAVRAAVRKLTTFISSLEYTPSCVPDTPL